MSEGLQLTLAGGAITLLGILISTIVAPYMQRRTDAVKADAAADEAAKARYDRLYRRYTALRETFERMRSDILRAIDIALVRLDGGGDLHRVAQLLEAVKVRLEALTLPGLDDDEKPKE